MLLVRLIQKAGQLTCLILKQDIKKSIPYQRTWISAATLSSRAVVVALTGRAARKHYAAAPNQNEKFDVKSHVTQEL